MLTEDTDLSGEQNDQIFELFFEYQARGEDCLSSTDLTEKKLVIKRLVEILSEKNQSRASVEKSVEKIARYISMKLNQVMASKGHQQIAAEDGRVLMIEVLMKTCYL